MADTIQPIIMPKWGLAMTEGLIASWNVEEGATISAGDEICEIETTKLANMFESPVSGLLRRCVAIEGEDLPVGALIAVVAASDVSDADIDAYITRFQENFVPEESDDTGPEPESVTVDGMRLMYLKQGDSDETPVLLLHGFGADMNGWLFNQGDLSETAPTYALDLPGHGKSAKVVGDGTLAWIAGVVEKFMTEISMTAVHLVGHSMGAGVALLVAANQPDSVKSLTLIAGAGLGEEVNIDFLEGYISAKRQKHLKPVLQQLVHDPSLISADMMEEVFKFKRIDGVIDGLNTLVKANFAEGKQKGSLRDVLSTLSMPVTVIWGKEDQIIPVSHTAGLPESVRVEIIEQSGHVPQMENAARVNQIINATIANA
ncbi:MAG: acetoin dehydrogenase dihydrolipoyllysine-residue acetyltransferase subunit [Granulosicoccus sp.]